MGAMLLVSQVRPCSDLQIMSRGIAGRARSCQGRVLEPLEGNR